MDRLLIQGGRPLFGRVSASGSKNAALPILAASLLCDAPLRIARVPRLGDVATMLALVESLGGCTEWHGDNELEIASVPHGPCRAPYRLVRGMRAGICVLGPLVARRGKGIVPLPGGCRLGDRPIDLHLRGLAALGAEIRFTRGAITATARQLRGACVDLTGPRGPTVTGTANVLSAAVLACGTTVITGAAAEPEIVELGRFLVAAGARIAGLGTSRLEIDGVAELEPRSWELIPDRIEAATLLLSGCITRGVVTVEQANHEQLKGVLEFLAETGVRLRVEPHRITVDARGQLRAASLAADVFPGIPTDVQPQATAYLATLRGASTVCDRVFPERFGHLVELARLGAAVRRTSSGAEIRGVARLVGARVHAPDLRAGAALVLAGLAAEGTTTLNGLHHLDRGYEALDEKLAMLGGQICRSENPAAVR